MSRKLMTALAAVTAGALLLPATGAAAGKGFDGLTLVTFTAPASDGFKVSFSASAGPRDGKQQASFSFNHGIQSVTYTVNGRGAIDGNRIEGDFGKFGSFSGTFTGEIKAGHDGKGCDPVVRRRTHFSGKLDVEGEHGFATARLTEADGRIIALVKDPDCVPPASERKPERKPEQVQLQACPARGTHLYAHLDRRRGISSFQVNTLERRGSVHIGRVAYVNGEESDFDVADDLSEATLTPGGPFSGSAEFADGKLTGDLVVEQLGLTEPVALTPAVTGIASGRDQPSC